MVKGTLVGLPIATLTSISQAAQQAIIAGAVRGLTYSIGGRSFSFPSLESASQLQIEAQYALDLINGNRSTNSRANFNVSFNRGTPNQ